MTFISKKLIELSVSVSKVNLNLGWYCLKSLRISSTPLAGIIVKMSSTYLLKVFTGKDDLFNLLAAGLVDISTSSQVGDST